jgi:hypothetical protein
MQHPVELTQQALLVASVASLEGTGRLFVPGSLNQRKLRLLPRLVSKLSTLSASVLQHFRLAFGDRSRIRPWLSCVSDRTLFAQLIFYGLLLFNLDCP